MGHHKPKRESRSRILSPLKKWKLPLELERILLEVLWVDSETDDDDWQSAKTFKPREDKLSVQTVGYVLDDNHTNLVIARSITNDETPLIEGVFSIPKCSIIKIRHLSRCGKMK